MQSKMQRWTSVRNKDSMSPYGGEGEQDSPPEEVSIVFICRRTKLL